MAQVVLDRAITENEWDALVDPDRGRYEVIDGQLVMTPSGDADHSRFGEDLADILRQSLEDAGLDLPVTLDVEWRTVATNIVTQAPRGDVVVGTRLDPITRVHADRPLLVAEIWSARTRPSERNSRRSYWASCGVAHYWEILLGHQPADARVNVYNLSTSADQLSSATGHEPLTVTEPFPVDVIPAEIHGWAKRESQRANAATQQAKAEAERADTATQQAKAEAERADTATQRADAEAERADAATERADAEAERASREAERSRRLEAELRRQGIELRD